MRVGHRTYPTLSLFRVERVERRGALSTQASDIAHSFPTLEHLKLLGSYWFKRTDPWARRHVEAVHVESDRDARCLLTVDFRLPEEKEAWCHWQGPNRLYLVPAALVSKEPRPSHVKVLDEHDGEVQLFTKDDNAEISAAALRAAATDMLAKAYLAGKRRTPSSGDNDGAKLSSSRRPDLLLHLLRQLTVSSGVTAWLYTAMAEQVLLCDDMMANDDRDRLLDLAKGLMASTMLWVPLIGVPGQMRSLRFEYHTTFKASPVLGKVWEKVRLTNTRIELEDHGTYTLEQAVSDSNTRHTSRRAWNRLARTTGFSSYELRLRKPYLYHTFSYHLQVEAPAGVEVRSIRLPGRIRWLDENGRVNQEATTTHGHLYFSKASSIEPGPALVELRVVRRGLLFFPALVATLISAMLWFFASHPQTAAVGNAGTVTGPILLITPALLLVFAFRQEEHPLLTHLLSGVRLLVLLAGVCSVAAAMGLVGIWPFGHFHTPGKHAQWENVGGNWHFEAIISTAIAGLLAMAWLLAFHTVDLVRSLVRKYCKKKKRYEQTAALLIIVQLAIGVAMHNRGTDAGFSLFALAATLAAAAALSGWLAAYGEVPNCRTSATCLVASGFLSVIVTLSFLGLDLQLESWHDVSRGSILFLGLLAAVALMQAVLRHHAAADTEPAPEPGYDLSATSAQGEDTLTREVIEVAQMMLADYWSKKSAEEQNVSFGARVRRFLLRPWEEKGEDKDGLLKLSLPKLTDDVPTSTTMAAPHVGSDRGGRI